MLGKIWWKTYIGLILIIAILTPDEYTITDISVVCMGISLIASVVENFYKEVKK